MITRKKKICECCNTEQFIFSSKLCKNCYSKLNFKKIKQGGTIKKVSSNQISRVEKYNELRNDYLENHKLCEVCNSNIATDIHHKKGRTGDNLYNHFLACCRTCHSHIENNIPESIEKGYIIKRN